MLDVSWMVGMALAATVDGSARTPVDALDHHAASPSVASPQVSTGNRTKVEDAVLSRFDDAAIEPPVWALEASGWTQLSLLLFPDAVVQEAGDGLAPTRLLAGAGPRRDRWRVSARDTRLHLRAHADTTLGAVLVHVEGDLFGSASDDYRPRLRRAGAEWTSASGRWRVGAGQDWSAFVDPDSFAPVYNPVQLGAVFVRQPQVRLTVRSSDGLSLTASAESGRRDAATAGGGLLPPLDGPIDVAISARLDRPWGSLQLGALRPATAGTWAVSLSGRVPLAWNADDDAVRFQVSHGRGVARYVGGLGTGSNRPSPGTPHVTAANLSYARGIGRGISAAAQVSYTSVRSGHRRSTTAAATFNVALHPKERLDVAAEYVAVVARRDSATGVEGELLRFATRLRF